MSTLVEGTDNLSPVKYGYLLEAISQHIKASVKDGSLMQIKSAPASISLRFVIDKIAEDVSKQFASSNKYPFTEKEGTVYACVHMPTSAEKDAFSNQVQRLIIQELQTALQTQAVSGSIEQMVTNLLKPISTFSDKTAAGLHYPLEKVYLFEKRRLHVQPKKAEDDPWLKGHKLTLRVEDIKSFVDQVIQGICAFLDQNACAKEDIDEARETLVMMARHPKSSLYRLQESITKESLARIQREARVLYLSYLYEGMKTWKTEKKAEGMKLLDILVQRLKAIDAFIRQEKEDAWYQVTYQDTACNFRALFSRADAFDMLPIISEIEGFLGESTDQLKGAKTFVSGLRLKLNGPVQIHSGGGRSVFEYNQALLYPGSEDYRKREEEASSPPRFREKVLRAALLYYFVFVNMDDPAFDPRAIFEEEVLGVLREGQEIADARHHVLESIQRAAARSFDDGRKFLQGLVHLADENEGVRWLEHEETLHDFVNTRTPLDPAQLSADVRNRLNPAAYVHRHILDVHAALTENELANFTPYLFLTGNPGIGKTTAIVNFLKRRVRQGENFLFMYISPRKQVNLDIIRKFQEDTGEPPCEDLFALTTNSLIIQNNNGLPTVHYYSQQRQDTFRENGVYFLFAEGEQAKEQRTARRHLEEIQEGLLIDKGKRISGVLDNLCRALQASIATLKPAPRAIVATVAIQSLKRTKNGQSTLQHLEKIFQGAYSTQHGVLPAQMAKIGQRIQHLFVMIDEVTGDESGAEFLEGIHKFLQKYELMDAKYGIHTKIIVADASIVDPQIIQQHLAETTYEPNKIYFRRVTPQQAQPLSIQSFTFKRKPAVVINANAYPASKLHITYKIGVDVLQYEEETFAERRKHLQQAVQARFVNDIMVVLNQPDPPQVLVYIQDKQRLALLIDEIHRVRGGAFEANEQYLEIHANISEEDKKTIAKVQHKVDVVFMTASASRGLSFYRARHILVDIPHFEIEQNLMEILQVIYRGRGGEYDQEEKWLTFYLADQVIYANETDRALSVRESMIHLLNVLLILKTSIMTRIVGSGALGVYQRFMMIPIGGKSVNAAGDTFTSRISRLLKELQDVSHSHRNDRRLTAVHTSLTRILSDVRIDLIGTNTGQTAANGKPAQQSYLNLLPTFTQSFIAATRKGFQHLLALPPLEKGYLSGNLLVVPIGNKSMQERYWMAVEEALEQKELKGLGFDLLTAMHGLSKDARYPESIHVALKDAIALIESLKDMPSVKNPRYQQESDHADQHYALPLVAFIVYDAMKAYFGSKPEQEEQNEGSFRALLASYIRTLYPADSILPIGSQYDIFPFAVFRCLDLAEARHKLFTDHYLFMSHELNILNMLLAS